LQSGEPNLYILVGEREMFFIFLLIWAGVSAIIGGILTAVTGFNLVGWAAGIFVFLCGLPGLIIASIHESFVAYPQDRADDRQTMADLNADFRASEHEWNEDQRMERYISASRPENTYDNRQINIHYSERCKKSE